MNLQNELKKRIKKRSSTTSSVVFITARMASIFVSSTAVHKYDFHISTVVNHHLEGLFGPKTLTSSHLACQLSWQSAAAVLQRSWVQIPNEPEIFFRPYFNYQFSSVHNCEDRFFNCSARIIFIYLQSVVTRYSHVYIYLYIYTRPKSGVIYPTPIHRISGGLENTTGQRYSLHIQSTLPNFFYCDLLFILLFRTPNQFYSPWNYFFS